ncbi:hypothetical protein ACJX0J_013446, partial [Zea mays]
MQRNELGSIARIQVFLCAIFCNISIPMAVLIITNFQAKALAEKNMRDMLVQREHAEKH